MDISSQATGEFQLEAMLKAVEGVWKDQELSVVSHHDQKDVFVLAGQEELQAVLDDSTVNMNTIAASKYVGTIKHKVDEWLEHLDQFGKTLGETTETVLTEMYFIYTLVMCLLSELWIECQTTWIYLEAIFASPDIQRQLPQEAKMFFQVDKSFKDLVRTAKKVSLALPVMSSTANYLLLKENNRLLDLINRGLEAYLEVKRVVFPRLDRNYFESSMQIIK